MKATPGNRLMTDAVIGRTDASDVCVLETEFAIERVRVGLVVSDHHQL